MSDEVFANGMEISGKATGNKSIAAMPDVCMSPPSPPAGPIPIPYPNTAMASDTTDGSTSVEIHGKEVHLKNKSSYKTSNGNQPATNNFGANVITHKITGAMKFAAWSMDVKVEGQNVVRFMDLTTHNHANPGGGAVTSSVAMASAALAGDDEDACAQLEEANRAHREEKQNIAADKGGISNEDAVATGVFTKGGGWKEVLAGTSNGMTWRFDNRFAVGLFPAGEDAPARAQRLQQRTKQGLVGSNGRAVSGVCGGGKFTYSSKPYEYPHYTSHAESRILEDFFENNPRGGKRLLLSIDWPTHPANRSPRSPCAACQKLLCAATECMEILICDEDNQPKPPRCG